jgi:hypothetical protein
MRRTGLLVPTGDVAEVRLDVGNAHGMLVVSIPCSYKVGAVSGQEPSLLYINDYKKYMGGTGYLKEETRS